MDKITEEEANKSCRINSYEFMNGHNFAVDIANKEIAELQKKVDELSQNYEGACKDLERWMEMYEDMKDQVVIRDKEIEELKQQFEVSKVQANNQSSIIDLCKKKALKLMEERDYWETQYEGLKKFEAATRDNPKQVEPDWYTRHLQAHIEFDERLRKLEASITDIMIVFASFKNVKP